MNLIRVPSLVMLSIVLFTACKKSDRLKSPTSNILSTISKLSTLSASPEFAKPIISKNENRIFSIELKSGEILNFDVTSSEQTVFGKARTLAGTVEIDHVKEKSIMMIAENGFALYYAHNNHMFTIKSIANLDLGYKQPIIDFTSETTKTQVADYAKAFGIAKTNSMIATYNKVKNELLTSNNNRYEAVVERTDKYTLIDMTLTSEKRESEKKLSSDHPDIDFLTTQQNRNEVAGNVDKTEPDNKFYNIEIAYKDNNFDFASEYAYLCFSFMTIDPGLTHVFWAPKVTQIKIMPSFKDIMQLASATVHVKNSTTQLENLIDYGRTYNNIPAGTCRIALYRNTWVDASGYSYIGTYKTSYSAARSACVISDEIYKALGHECGHNLGARQLTNTPGDIMNSEGNSPWHHNAANLYAIRANFGF